MHNCHRYLCLAVLLIAGLFSRTSHADEVAPGTAAEVAEVRLKSGETVRGTLVQVEPGQRVIVIVAGQESVIPWDQVAQVVDGGAPVAPPKAPPVPAPPPAKAAAPVAEAAASSRGMPFLHVESDYPELELARVDGMIGPGFQISNALAANALNRFICRAPCNKLVDGRDGHRFFFTAPGMMPSRHFRLDDVDGHVTARVHGVSTMRFTGGVVLATLGGTIALTGGTLFLTGGLLSASGPSDPDRGANEVGSALFITGGVTLALGAGMLAGGIAMLAKGKTRVELVKPNGTSTGVFLEPAGLLF